MLIKLNGILVKSLTDIKIIPIQVKDKNHAKLIKLKLQLENQKAVLILRGLQKAGLIKSIFRPKNKQMQNQLDRIVKSKKEIQRGLKILQQFF